MMPRFVALLALCTTLGACRSGADRTPATPVAVPAFTTLAPGLRVNASAGVVELDGFVAEDVHHPDTPRVYLEVIVCARDSREHESLVVTDVPPSLVHAALLTAGLEPGSVGSIDANPEGQLARLPATGDAVRVTFLVDGAPKDPLAWVIHADTNKHLADRDASFVFAGSAIRQRAGRTWYAADGEGTLVGLATFGTETIALTESFSHASAIDEPVWIADRTRVPAKGAPVVVRIERLD